MSKLELLIHGYRKLERFAPIGDAVIQVFNPLLTEYKLKSLKLTKEQRDKFYIRYDYLLDTDLLFLLEETKQKEENSLLCITNLCPLIPNELFKMRIAACYPKTKVAFVTTKTRVTNPYINKNYLEALTIESLHEVGHFFGLNHHDKKLVYGDEKLCPMTTISQEAIKKSFLEYGEYMKLRGKIFCKKCQKKLFK